MPKTAPIILFNKPRAISFKNFVKSLAIALNIMTVNKNIIIDERIEIKTASDSNIGFSIMSKFG